MNRVRTTFLVLLSLATLFSGQLWVRGETLINGQGTSLDAALVAVSAFLLLPILLALGRIVYRTAKVSSPEEPQEEVSDV